MREGRWCEDDRLQVSLATFAPFSRFTTPTLLLFLLLLLLLFLLLVLLHKLLDYQNVSNNTGRRERSYHCSYLGTFPGLPKAAPKALPTDPKEETDDSARGGGPPPLPPRSMVGLSSTVTT